MGGYSQVPGGGGSLASCVDDNPDLNWGVCSPGEERFLTVTRDGTGATLTCLLFTGDTGSFAITSLDGTPIGPFPCGDPLNVALGDVGDILYGEEAVVGISTVFDAGLAASMDIDILDAGGAVVATRTAQATVQDPFLSLCETHGDLLYIYGARDLPTGDLAGDGSAVFEDLSSVGAPDIVYKRDVSQTILWRTRDDDPCGVTSVLAKCSESDHRQGYANVGDAQYGIAASAPGAAQTWLVFFKYANPILDCRESNADWVSFGGYVGDELAPGGYPNPRARCLTPGPAGKNLGFGLNATYSKRNMTISQGDWHCVVYSNVNNNTFSSAMTVMGNAWGDVQAWGSTAFGGVMQHDDGLQMGYMTNNGNTKIQDGVRIAGIVGFSGIKNEAECIALYEAAAGI